MSAPRELSAETLLEITRAMQLARDPDVLLRSFFERVREIVPINGLVLALVQPSGKSVRLVGASVDRPFPIPPGPFPVEGTSIESVLATGRPYRSGNLAEGDIRYPDEELHRSLGVSCTALLPLGAPERPIGTIRFGRAESPCFTDTEMASLVELSEPLTLSLQHVLDLERMRRMAARERSLLDISTAVTVLREPRKVFEALGTALSTVMPYDRMVVMELEGAMLHPAAVKMTEPGSMPAPRPFPLKGSHLEELVRQRKPRFFRLEEQNYPQFPGMQRAGIRSLIAAPIEIEGQVFGVFTAASRQAEAYSDEDVDLVFRAAQQFGLALESARAHERNVRLARRERDLQELTYAITGHLDPRELFESLATALKALARFDWAMAFELDGEWLIPLATNAPPGAREALFERHALRESLISQALSSAGPLLFGPEEAAGFRSSWIFEHGYARGLILPVSLNEQTLGALILVSRDPRAFPEADRDILLRAARQFGVAIQSARSFAEVQRLAQRERDLLDIANALTTFRNPTDMFPAIIEALHRLVDFDRSLLFQIEGEWMHPLAAGTPEDRRESMLAPRRWAESSARASIESRLPTRHLVEQLKTPGSARMAELGLRVLAHVPVLEQDRVLAIFALASRNPEALSSTDLALVARAAQQFALALDNARAHAENLRLAERERDLLELTNAMTLHRDPQEILARVLPALGRLTHFEPQDMAAVFELEGSFLRPAAINVAEIREDPSWKPYHWPDLPLAPIIRSGSTQRMTLAEEWSPMVVRLKQLGFRTMLFVPLIIQEMTVGLLWLASRRDEAFQGEELETLSRVAQQFGLALEAARGYLEIQKREQKLEQEVIYLKEELSSEGAGAFDVVGAGMGAALEPVRRLVGKVARTDTPVLLRGESGTGKELVAEALHRLSARADQALIRVNCAALPESLIGSELFGHEKGAFTGAVAQRLGRFELARSGTIFLDEIGELSLEVQSKLLRVLQQGEFERVGSSITLRTDARVIAATNRNLERAVSEGNFREDLFYRLNVFPIHLPPLRERRDDIILLALYFLHHHARKLGKNIQRLAPETEERLLAYPWPGNVRELQNVIERAVIVNEGDSLLVEPMQLEGPPPREEAPARPETEDEPDGQSSTLTEAERRHIVQALRRAGGRIGGPGGAAELLGMRRTTLNSRIKKLGIAKIDYIQ